MGQGAIRVFEVKTLNTQGLDGSGNLLRYRLGRPDIEGAVSNFVVELGGAGGAPAAFGATLVAASDPIQTKLRLSFNIYICNVTG